MEYIYNLIGNLTEDTKALYNTIIESISDYTKSYKKDSDYLIAINNKPCIVNINRLGNISICFLVDQCEYNLIRKTLKLKYKKDLLFTKSQLKKYIDNCINVAAFKNGNYKDINL